jgi:excisionase family DNA binding protein
VKTIFDKLSEIPGLIDTNEVAAITGNKPDTIREFVTRGQLKGIKVGRELKFDPADVAAFLQENRVGR